MKTNRLKTAFNVGDEAFFIRDIPEAYSVHACLIMDVTIKIFKGNKKVSYGVSYFGDTCSRQAHNIPENRVFATRELAEAKVKELNKEGE